jgi:putative addiction module component (TIGR02574 family)
MIDVTKPMTITVSELSTDERLELIGAIWDTLAQNPAVLAPSEAQKRELDRRLDEYEKDPDRGSSWEDVKRRIMGR